MASFWLRFFQPTWIDVDERMSNYDMKQCSLFHPESRHALMGDGCVVKQFRSCTRLSCLDYVALRCTSTGLRVVSQVVCETPEVDFLFCEKSRSWGVTLFACRRERKPPYSIGCRLDAAGHLICTFIYLFNLSISR